MFKKFYLLALIFLAASSLLQADETEPVAVEKSSIVEEIASKIPEIPEVPEEELIELVGYFTALSGGVPALKLNEVEVAALSEGLEKGIAGEWSLQDFPQEAIQAAFVQAQARATALQKEETDEDDEEETDEAEEDAEAGEEVAESGEDVIEIPVIDLDALKKIGLVMVSQSGLDQLGFSVEDAARIKKGFITGSSVTEPGAEIEAKMPAFQKFIRARVEKAQAAAAAKAEAVAAERIATGKAFFEELVEDADVQKSESGLHYKVLEPGADEKPTLQDTVLVHYKGTLIDGTKFDSSYDRGTPAKFPLSGVVPGFGEGLTKVGAGGKIILYIPSELGYGNSPRPGGAIKPGDTLIFECELIEVNPE